MRHHRSSNFATYTRPLTEFQQADKLSTIISAAKLEVEPIWTQLFAKVRTHLSRISSIHAHSLRIH